MSNYWKRKASQTALATACVLTLTHMPFKDERGAMQTAIRECVAKRRIARSMARTKESLTLDYNAYNKGNVEGKYDALRASIKHSLDYGSREGGLFVLGAPPRHNTERRSVCLREMVCALVREHAAVTGVAVIRFNEDEGEDISLSSLCSRLGIPSHGEKEFERFLPQGSLLLIDMCDYDHHTHSQILDDKAKMLFTALATQSRNSRALFIVVCVSRPETYAQILQCNGGRKVYPLCDPSLMIKYNNNVDNNNDSDQDNTDNDDRVVWERFQKAYNDFYSGGDEHGEYWYNRMIRWFIAY